MATRLYTLEVTLAEGPMTEEFVARNPVVSRTIEVRGDQTLERLHRAIFRALDREDDCHLYEFEVGRRPHDRHADRYVLPHIYTDPEEIDDPRAAGSVAKTRLDDLELRVRRVFWYLFDHGDGWYHRIRVTAIGEAEPKVRYPRVIARVGESPPQYLDWDEDEPESDWIAEVLDGHPRIGTAEMGFVPIEDEGRASWIRWPISAEQASLARDVTTQQVYQVTTLRGLPDGTSVLTAYIVHGALLAPWLAKLAEPSEEPEVLLSVEVA